MRVIKLVFLAGGFSHSAQCYRRPMRLSKPRACERLIQLESACVGAYLSIEVV